MPAPYPWEFRREAVSLLKRSGKSVPALAAELGCLTAVAAELGAPDRRRWGVRRPDIDERDELRRLRRENRVLTEEREILKKRRLLRQGRRDPVTAFGFIAAKRTEHSVKTMCRVLGVSRSGFHAWESGRRRRERSRTRG